MKKRQGFFLFFFQAINGDPEGVIMGRCHQGQGNISDLYDMKNSGTETGEGE